MINAYCHSVNDGFGCPDMHEGVEPDICLDCLLGVMSDMFSDIQDLSNKVLKKIEVRKHE